MGAIHTQRLLAGANLWSSKPVWLLGVRDADPEQLRGNLDKIQSGAFPEAVLGSRCWSDAEGAWVAYEFVDENAGKEAGRLAAEEFDLDHIGAVRKAIKLETPSVAAILEEARRRNIPVIRRGDTIQLGWGGKQQNLLGSLPATIAGLGHDIARDTVRAHFILSEAGLRVAPSDEASTWAGTQEIAERLEFPIALQSLAGPPRIACANMVELEAAYDQAKLMHRWVTLTKISQRSAYALVVADRLVGVLQEGVDVTHMVHPSIELACRRAARLVGLQIAGVELAADAVDQDMDASSARILAIDAEPDLSQFEFAGASALVLDTLFSDDGRIPLVSVTGTNGKTTTVRLIAHIMKYSGGHVGLACTGAIEVDSQVVLRGDYSGPVAAQTVLQEPGITHAVCEVARGGILRRGIGFDQCDAAVVMNIGRDHMGQGGVETLQDLANVKAVLLKTIGPGGTAVLNADDPLVWEMRHRCERVVPFTFDTKLAARLAVDHPAVVTVESGHIVVVRGRAKFRVAPVTEIPITLEGAARFNIQNAMAATAVAFAIGIREEHCRAALLTFNPSPTQLPGRMNVIVLGGVKVVIDYGHNVPALEALAQVLPRLGLGRKLNVASGAGNRPDDDLIAFGAQLATMYDEIIVCDPDPRKRNVGETAELVRQGLKRGNAKSIEIVLDEVTAIKRALAKSRPGDVVVLQVDDIQRALFLCKGLQTRLNAGESPTALNLELAPSLATVPNSESDSI